MVEAVLARLKKAGYESREGREGGTDSVTLSNTQGNGGYLLNMSWPRRGEETWSRQPKLTAGSALFIIATAHPDPQAAEGRTQGDETHRIAI